PDPRDPRGAPGSDHAPGDEGNADGRAQGAREDPPRRVDELMPPRRRPEPEPTLSIFPDQVHIGDRFMDADIGDETRSGRWPHGRSRSRRATRSARAFSG